MNEADRKILSNITNDINTLTDDQLEKLSHELEWRSFGIGEVREMKLRPLVELETSHLENILITQRHIAFQTSKVILYILKKRYYADARCRGCSGGRSRGRHKHPVKSRVKST